MNVYERYIRDRHENAHHPRCEAESAVLVCFDNGAELVAEVEAVAAAHKRSRSPAESLLSQITLLGEALERLDQIDSVPYTAALEDAVTDLTAVAREIVAMAHPLFKAEDTFACAMHTATRRNDGDVNRPRKEL